MSQKQDDYELKVKRIVLIVLLISFISFLGFVAINNWSVRTREIDEMEVFGIVDSLKFSNRSRYFLVNGKWIPISYGGEELNNIVVPGDSISKEKGKGWIHVYKKNKPDEGFKLIHKVDM